MMNRIVVGMMFLVLFASVSNFVRAETAEDSTESEIGDSQHGQKQGSNRRQKWLEELQLTEEQKTQIKDLREKHEAEMESYKSEIKSAQDEFKSSIQSNATDEVLREKFQNVQTLKSKIGTLRFEQMLQIRSLLTEEQKAKFKGLQHKMRQRKQHSGKGFRGRDGKGSGLKDAL